MGSEPFTNTDVTTVLVLNGLALLTIVAGGIRWMRTRMTAWISEAITKTVSEPLRALTERDDRLEAELAKVNRRLRKMRREVDKSNTDNEERR